MLVGACVEFLPIDVDPRESLLRRRPPDAFEGGHLPDRGFWRPVGAPQAEPTFPGRLVQGRVGPEGFGVVPVTPEHRAEKAEAEVERLEKQLSNHDGSEFMYQFARLEFLKAEAQNKALRDVGEDLFAYVAQHRAGQFFEHDAWCSLVFDPTSQCDCVSDKLVAFRKSQQALKETAMKQESIEQTNDQDANGRIIR